MNEIQSTKSILAKLLASENITVEHGNYQTASFDVKNRVIRLPIFKYMSGPIYDLMVLHEVGHALWTPLKGLHSEKNEKGPGFKSYLNVVEDARIEKKIKRKYPGGTKPMIEGYRQLVSENFFATKNVDLESLNLIDRINLHYKIGASAGIEFDEMERPFITEIDKAESFDEIYDISVRLYEYSKENESQTDFQDFSEFEYSIKDFDDENECERMPDMMGDSPLDFMEEEEERNDAKAGMRGDSIDSEEDEEDEEDKESQMKVDSENGSSAGDSEDTNEEDVETGGQITSGQMGGVSNDEKFDPKSITDEAWQSAVGDLNEEEGRTYQYATIPKANLDEVIVPHKELYKMTKEFFADPKWNDSRNGNFDECFAKAQEMVKDFKRKNSNTVDFLVKEFEMKKRADEYKRTSVSKTGLLDMSSIHSYKYNDNLFKKVATIASGKNHGLVLFIDWSGSMHTNLPGTIDQLLNLVLFCRKANIPFDVYAFTDRNIREADWNNSFDEQEEQTEKQKHKVFFKKEGHITSNSSLFLMNMFSSSMSTSELNYAMQIMMQLKMRYDTESYYGFRYSIPYHFELGGTPLDATIITALELVPEFQRKNRVQIVNTVFLTDGESHCNSQYWKANEAGNLERQYFSVDSRETFYVDPVTKKTYGSSKGMRRGLSTKVFYQILKDRCNVNILGFFLTGKRFKYISSDISWGTKNAPSPADIFRLWKKEKSYVASDYLGYDKLYYIKDGQDLNVGEEDFVVREDASKSQLTKAFKTFNKKKLTNRIVLKSFAEMVA
jgi:hypothetical protein